MHPRSFSSPPGRRPPIRWNYDVFLSFRSVDTRHGFTKDLYDALSNNGIYTFMDDLRTRKGEDIGKELNDKIQQSKASIVVFSEKYADSRWCLDELVTIVECNEKKDEDKVILCPIFYNMDPYEETHKNNMAQLEKIDDSYKVRVWRKALQKLYNHRLPWHLKPGMHEAHFIQQIVNEVSKKLDRRRLNVSDYLNWQLDDHVHDINPTPGIGLDSIYSVKKLTDSHSFHLFCWYAFKKAKPPSDMEELLDRILQSLCGTPLAIKVMGCHLYGRSDTEEWKEAIVRLEKKDVSYEQLVHTTMTISYEGLDASEKTTFVLISCFLNGKERDEIVEVLSDSGQTFGGCIDVLVSKCLVCVDRTKLWVHDLAREMAMKILGSISPLIKSRQFDQCIPKGLKNSEIQLIARYIFLEIMEDDKCYSDQEGTNGAK